MTPRVTVLLAVRDGEPFVRRCVESVLGQTFRDFELLVVDDASADGTPELVTSFADDRISLLRNERNLGQVPSLNRGLREARGEYVARIDADDWCRPGRLERQVAVLDAEPAVGLVGSWMDVVDDRDRPVGSLRSTISDFAEFVYHTLIMRVYVAHPAAMYRRAPVAALGGYDESTGPAEDKDLWRRLALGRWDARIVPEPLVVYRLHENQLSQTRAGYQRRVDAESQERFLAALCAEAPARPLRLLLAADPELWAAEHDPGALLGGLERLLAGAAARLDLSAAESARLDELVGGRLLEVARARPWRASARALAAGGLRRVPRERRGPALAAHAAALVVAPPTLALRRALRGLSAGADAVPPLRALRGPASRSRLARRLYGKLVGGS